MDEGKKEKNVEGLRMKTINKRYKDYKQTKTEVKPANKQKQKLNLQSKFSKMQG